MSLEGILSQITDFEYKYPSSFLSRSWNNYENRTERNNRYDNYLFKLILSTVFRKESLFPFYENSKVLDLAYTNYDFVFHSSVSDNTLYRPICISAKTSLRERYKQADLEAIALKYVHRKALSFLVTLNSAEAKSVKGKIKSCDVIGLDRVIVATSSEFDELIIELKEYQFSEPPTVKVIQSNQIVTLEKVAALK
jgi:hypothetical protein